MKRLLVVSCIALSCMSFAQDTHLGIKVGLAYGWSDTFKSRSGSSLSLTGPELYVDIPLYSQKSYDLWLEPTYFAAGRIVAGNTQGDVFRFTLMGTLNVGSRTYLKGGLGFGHSSAQNGQFASEESIVGEVGVGVYAGNFLGNSIKPNIEATYFGANAGSLRGLFIGVVAGF